MIITPRIRGFVCITAHPSGCSANVQSQIDRVNHPSQPGPTKVLVLGSSTGYGLSSRIEAAFAYKAATIGVAFERAPEADKPASPGWYNNQAFEAKAHAANLYAKTFNADAFSPETKEAVIAKIKEDLGFVDLVIYSLAAPRRTDMRTGEVHKSVLKPIGKVFESKTLDTDRHQVKMVKLEPASAEEIEGTRKVMGGEDWFDWIRALKEANVLAPHAKTVAYSYIGPEITSPIYRSGTIGVAKKDLEETASSLRALLAPGGGEAWVSINKCLVTQASSAIPVVPLYISLLYKVMKSKGIHEDCFDQIQRLFQTQLYSSHPITLDEEQRIRMDDRELREDVQREVQALWSQVTTETLDQQTDYAGYKEGFLQLFGFNWPGVDYECDVDPMGRSVV